LTEDVLHGLRIYWFVLRASMLPKQVKVKNRACRVGHFQYGGRQRRSQAGWSVVKTVSQCVFSTFSAT